MTFCKSVLTSAVPNVPRGRAFVGRLLPSSVAANSAGNARMLAGRGSVDLIWLMLLVLGGSWPLIAALRRFSATLWRACTTVGP